MHWGPPDTTELYYQEINRGGRSGGACDAIIISKDSEFDQFEGMFFCKHTHTKVTGLSMSTNTTWWI